jgi:uncharacterized membrane protein
MVAREREKVVQLKLLHHRQALIDPMIPFWLYENGGFVLSQGVILFSLAINLPPKKKPIFIPVLFLFKTVGLPWNRAADAERR